MRLLVRRAALSGFLLVGATEAYSQTSAPGPAATPGPAPPEVIKQQTAASGVITPPANVDPGINQPTPPGVNFPTPSVHPLPSEPNGPRVVPK